MQLYLHALVSQSAVVSYCVLIPAGALGTVKTVAYGYGPPFVCMLATRQGAGQANSCAGQHSSSHVAGSVLGLTT